jgi:hypothetical protein
MSLKDQLNADLKTAMKAGDEARKTTLRSLMAAIKQVEIDQRGSGATQDEAAILAIIQKEAKSRRESIADARKAERADLVADYEAELQIIESYLPRQLTREQLVELAQAAIAEAGVTDAKQIGAVMKILSPRTKGQADGKLVNEVVRELLTP